VPGEPLAESPAPLAVRADVPEPLSYRVKRRLLGAPIISSRLSQERLSKVVALGVLSPDCISSSAYGSEEMLRILVPVIGTAAFSMLLPVTGAILLVLLVITLAYRDVVMIYTRIGGSYAVTRENFGVKVAQIAAVALLIDYVVTVAVQTAAGTDAVLSILHLLVHTTVLDPYALEVTIGIVLLLGFGNLRGLREAGRMFAVPTYLFAATTGVVIVTGLARAAFGALPSADEHAHGTVSFGHAGGGLLLGASVFMLLRAFANGGSSLTGLEAISDSVPAFKSPEGPNARRTLVVMATILGSLVLGVSLLAYLTHATPYGSGAPTVIAQEAHLVFGSSLAGRVGFTIQQIATALILYTGANTSFNGFPFLASYVANDSFLPRYFTHRGHRLAYSNGIIVLFGAAVALLVVTGASVDRLVAVYAIGVFTSFTMTGLGMTRYHLRRGGPWPRVAINGSAAAISAVVVVIFAVTKFTQGAWVVVVLFPLLVWGLIHTHRSYEAEDQAIESFDDAPAEANISRHEVLVLVDSLDVATVRGLRYARSIRPTRVRALHFVVDEDHADQLRKRWAHHRAAEIPLEMIDCPDRRVTRAAVEVAVLAAADGNSEVTILLPRRSSTGPLSRLLHDRTADSIAVAVTKLPRIAATIVPVDPRQRSWRSVRTAPALPDRPGAADRPLGARPTGEPDGRPAPAAEAGPDQPVAAERARPTAGAATGAARPPGVTPIAGLLHRQRARVRGQVHSLEVTAKTDTPVLRVTLVDDTAGVALLFLGRREIPGIKPGARLEVEGMVGQEAGHLAIANPTYRLLPDPAASGGHPHG
jgi:amino acid transporter